MAKKQLGNIALMVIGEFDPPGGTLSRLAFRGQGLGSNPWIQKVLDKTPQTVFKDLSRAEKVAFLGYSVIPTDRCAKTIKL